MPLHIYDVAFNNAFDRGNLLDFDHKAWGHPRVLVPPTHHDEVFGYVLLMDLKGRFQKVHWSFGMTCLEGWMVVIGPATEHFVFDGVHMPRLEPRKKDHVRRLHVERPPV